MYIVNRMTREVVAEVITNHSISLDDAINLVGEYRNPEADEADVFINDKEYWYCDLDLVASLEDDDE